MLLVYLGVWGIWCLPFQSLWASGEAAVEQVKGPQSRRLLKGSKCVLHTHTQDLVLPGVCKAADLHCRRDLSGEEAGQQLCKVGVMIAIFTAKETESQRR
jgi:hypothetical protein